jgi:pseudaminic acid synthase
MNYTIEINGLKICSSGRAFIVAELSANHAGSFERAVETIRAASRCGVDAIKIQTYTPDTLTIDCDNKYFRISGDSLWDGRTLYDLYAEAHTPWDWQPELKAEAERCGLIFFSTPFDHSAVEFLERLEVPAYKIASFEIVDLPLLQCVAATGKPVILSTGMSSLPEIEEAVETLRKGGAKQIALLKCTSAYPARPEEMNLLSLNTLREHFKVPVGLSDHSLDMSVPVAAVALGASIVEKHFILSRSQGGPDAAFSLEPDEMRQTVDAIRNTTAALGSTVIRAQEREKPNLVFRRSIFVVKDIARGEPFTRDNLRIIRPGYGLHPREFESVLGRRASVNIELGTPLSRELLDES